MRHCVKCTYITKCIFDLKNHLKEVIKRSICKYQIAIINKWT